MVLQGTMTRKLQYALCKNVPTRFYLVNTHSMELHALSQADYLDILFENRNKKYGSYELRRHYAQRVQRAMAIVLGCAGMLIGYSQLKGSKQRAHLNAVVTHKEVHPKDIIFEMPKPKPAKPSPPPPAAATSKPIVAFTVPVITKDKILIGPPTQAMLTNKASGLVTTTNAADSAGDVASPVAGTKHEKTKGSEEVVAVADVMPEFIGDLNQYLSRNLTYPQRAREANIEGKVIIRFVVNEDGSVTGATVMRGIGGGCDKEALRVVNHMQAWKPGMQAGKAVKVYYTLPIRFVLD